MVKQATFAVAQWAHRHTSGTHIGCLTYSGLRFRVARMHRLFLVLALLTVGEATISANFKEFVSAKYGKAIAEALARTDLGAGGSYGGGDHKAGTTTK